MRKVSFIIMGMLFLPSVFTFAQTKITFEQALESAVANNYDIQLKKAAVQSAAGQYKRVFGTTDVTIGASAAYSDNHNPIDENDPNYYYGSSAVTYLSEGTYDYYGVYQEDSESKQFSTSLWAQKLFSFGLNTKLSYEVVRSLTEGDYSYNNDIPTYGSYWSTGTKLPTDEARNYGTLKLEMSLPLFKSFNQSITENNIKAARAYLEQISFELNDAISQTVISTANTYWNFLLAHNKLEQLKIMHTKLSDRDKNMEQLITAGIRSRNDLLGMQVNEIENARNILAAETEYNDACLKLKIAMGYTNQEIPVVEPDYSFPEIDFESIRLPSTADINQDLVNKIIEKRADIQALQKQVEYAANTLKATSVDERPDAALNFSIGTTGVTYSDSYSDYLLSGADNIKGANIIGGISFSMALPNNSKKGATEGAAASLKQAQIQLEQVTNNLNFN